MNKAESRMLDRIRVRRNREKRTPSRRSYTVSAMKSRIRTAQAEVDILVDLLKAKERKLKATQRQLEKAYPLLVAAKQYYELPSTDALCRVELETKNWLNNKAKKTRLCYECRTAKAVSLFQEGKCICRECASKRAVIRSDRRTQNGTTR